MIFISKFSSYFKTIIFYITLGIILLIYLNYNLVGISLASLLFILYLFSFLITLSSKRRLLKAIRDYPIISDKEISHKLERPLDNVRTILFSLSKNQRKKKWLVVYLNTRYMFLNESAVENFKQLYNRGYNEKKILEHLQRNTRIKSRAEVKAIELTLVNQKRLKNK